MSGTSPRPGAMRAPKERYQSVPRGWRGGGDGSEPLRHGHGLHLGCDSLESYLDLREKMLDEDVAAGIRLWHTKQAVYHFDREAMEQLEATVKDLQAKSFDVAVSLQPALAYALPCVHLAR